MRGVDSGSDPIARRPDYDVYRPMVQHRAERSSKLVAGALSICAPYLQQKTATMSVLDVGCGYGHMAIEFARQCRSVTGIEPSRELFEYATTLRQKHDALNLQIRHEAADQFAETTQYDLIVLDNVLEHIAAQETALKQIAGSVRDGGVIYIVVPNKWWPIEVHYRLPFLSLLPIPLANFYLRATGRGTDYTDASYAPSYFSLKRLLRHLPGFESHFVVPGNLSGAIFGRSWHYRIGTWMLRRFPLLWPMSKMFVVVLKKNGQHVATPKLLVGEADGSSTD